MKREDVIININGVERYLPKANEIWRHFKDGREYIIIGYARNATTGEESRKILYHPLYASLDEYGSHYRYFFRDIEDFMSEVDKEKYPDAQQKYRFENTGR